MMQYSFSTVLMAVLSSNIIIIFTAVCFCHKDALVSIGYKMFALLLGIAILRFMFPLAFPFTDNINLPDALSQAVLYFRHPLFMVVGVEVSAWQIFEFVWLAGAIVKLVKYVRTELAFSRTVNLCGTDVTHGGCYPRLMDEICGDRPNPFRIIEVPGLKVPVLYGMRHPRILVPAGMAMPEGDLRYLLSHEASHHFHHDIVIKTVVCILAIIYWWNPACYALKAQLDAILEMRTDDCVAGNTFESKLGYLNCLVHVAELGIDGDTKNVRVPDNSIALFKSRTFNNLVNRFNVMGGEPKPYSKPLHIAALAMAATLYLCSYLFIFEAWYAIPEENVIEPTNSDIYAVLTEDNTYEIYYGGFLLETVDSLEDNNKDTPVYNSLDEVPEELRVIIER